MLKRYSFISILTLCLTAASSEAQTVIKLNPESEGRYTLNASVNGVGVKTYYTEESWFASASPTTYLFLIENGYIDQNDVKGMTVMKMPDGSTIKAGSFIIRNLRIGNVIVKDLPAFVIKNQSVPLVVGNSSFDCFGDVALKGNELLIFDGIERNVNMPEEQEGDTVSPLDGIKQAARECIDSKNYPEAVKYLEILKSEAALGMYDEYQYILILNALGRSNDTIRLGKEWLASYEGKTTYLDYGMLDAIGSSYAKKGDRTNSIEIYERAVSAYYAMFNMDEKSMLRSPRQDNSLGDTLFELARQYAANGNLLKSQHCYFVSSRCGNEKAAEVCRRYNIKR